LPASYHPGFGGVKQSGWGAFEECLVTGRNADRPADPSGHPAKSLLSDRGCLGYTDDRGIIRRMDSGPTPGGNAEETQPTPALSADSTQPVPTQPVITQPSAWRRLRWFVLLIPAAVLLAGAAGYRVGGRQQQAARRQAVAEIARQQYELAAQDLQAGRFQLAAGRFEYVIRLDPSYPEASARLIEALVAIEEPIASATVAPTPTPNLAPVEELFAQAQAAFAAEDWTRVIDTLLALRAKDPTYHAADADGMMFAALRNRGLYRIRIEWQLEPGLYDLSLAERFGPLDKEAEDWRASARFYLFADTYMGLRWGEATDLFFQICAPAALWDSCDRAAEAAQRYAEQLLAMTDACAAQQEYEQWGWPADYPILQPVYDAGAEVASACAASRQPPPATETPTPTPGGPPAETPTLEASPSSP
jgi:hypothetical protein